MSPPPSPSPVRRIRRTRAGFRSCGSVGLALVAIFVLHLGLSLAYNAIIPLRRGPDEESHYSYVKHLIAYRSLPVITRPGEVDGTRDERDGAIAIHPPLSYVAALPVYLAVAGCEEPVRERALRLLATVYAVGTLLLTLRIARLLFPMEGIPASASAAAQCLMVGFVALLPHFLLLSSVVNNDGLFILLNTWLLLLIVQSHVALSPAPPLIPIGIVFGLCLLTKASALALFPLMVIVALLRANDGREYNVVKWARNCVALMVPAALIAGWWYVWYAQAHARLTFIPRDTRFGPPLRYDSIAQWLLDENRWFAVGRFVDGIARSLWSQVDWILPNDPAHPEQATSAAYLLSASLWRVFMILSLAAVPLGLLFALRKPEAGRPFALLALHWLLLLSALLYSTLFIHPGGFQGGRYLLPGVGALGAAVAMAGCGLAQLTRRSVTLRLWSACWLLPLVVWNYTCIRNLLEFLIPVYAR